MDGTVATAQRTPGGPEGEMCFFVPRLTAATEDANIPIVVHLTPCNNPQSALVCATSFMYGRERSPAAPATAPVASSDEDSEDTPDSSMCDEDGDDDDNRSPNAGSQSSPKQLMTIRERMVEFVNNPKSSGRLAIVQQPPSRVVWKNRRLDTPFKIRVEGISGDKISILAIVVDHKGKLQIDAMENFEEECPQGGIYLRLSFVAFY